MSQPPPPTTLESLPPEILLALLHRVTDLASLSSLVRASPVLWRLSCGGCGGDPAILDSVLAGSCAPQVVQLVRLVAAIRHGRFFNEISLGGSTQQEDGYMRVYSRFMNCYTGRSHGSPMPPLVSIYHHGDTSSGSSSEANPDAEEPRTVAAVRQLLATGARITRLAVPCLQYFLSRCASSELEPAHPTDPLRRYKKSRGTRTLPPPAGDHEDDEKDDDDDDDWGPGRRYWLPDDTGPPTWLEAQRVVRALWRIEALAALKEAAATAAARAAEAGGQGAARRGGYLEEMRRSTPRSLFRHGGWSGLDELDTVREFLDSDGDGEDEDDHTGDAAAAAALHGRFAPPPPPPPSPPPAGAATQASSSSSSLDAMLSTHAPGSSFFHSLRRGSASPVRRMRVVLPREPYQRLGLFLFDLWRLDAMGLVNGAGTSASGSGSGSGSGGGGGEATDDDNDGGGGRVGRDDDVDDAQRMRFTANGDMYFTWLSLLGPGVLASLPVRGGGSAGSGRP